MATPDPSDYVFPLWHDGVVLENGELTSEEAVPTYKLPSRLRNSKPIDNLQHPLVNSFSSTNRETCQKPHHANADPKSLLTNREASIDANSEEIPLSIGTSETCHATDDPETRKSNKKKRRRRKAKPQTGLEHDTPRKEALWIGRSDLGGSSNPKHLEENGGPSIHTHPDNESSAERDMLSALDAHLEQFQARFRAAAGPSLGGVPGEKASTA